MKNFKKTLLTSLIVVGTLSAPFAVEAARSAKAANQNDLAILHSPVMLASKVNAFEYVGYKWHDDTITNTGLPRNFRMSTSAFGKPDKIYNLDENYPVSHEGLDTLHLSGSAEYSAEQFHNMLKTIGNKYTVYVVDLRQENHLLANGNSICWFGKNNWSNLDKDVVEIEAEEATLEQKIAGKDIEVDHFKYEKKYDGDPIKLKVTKVMTERVLVEDTGNSYLRLACTDHIWPAAKQIDSFIKLYKTLPNNAWVHFHCVNGVGRTGAFMCMYDIMRNPNVKLKDIAYRQHLLGGNYLLWGGPNTAEGAYKAEIALMLTAFYSYAHECGPDGYRVSWSEWLAKH